MTSDDWLHLKITDKIRQILNELPVDTYPYSSITTRVFLSAEQIAIELKQRYPDDFKDMSLVGDDHSTSLPAYVNHWLPNVIDAQDIELAFVYEQHLKSVTFDVQASASTSYLTLFRLRSDQ